MNKSKTMNIDYNEIKLWVMNDSFLYDWYKRSGMSISGFIKVNNKRLRSIIRNVIG